MRTRALIAGCFLVLAPTAALAEFQISVYGGGNIANDSDVTLKQGALSGTFGVQWFGGDSSEWRAPYYGVRGTYWMTDFGLPNWGAAVDWTHAKVTADLGDPAIGGTFKRLEFTNGINSLTLNALYRMPLNNRFTVYVGAGAGASIPHVEVETIPSLGETYEFQLTGPVVQGLVGVSVPVGWGFSVFGEYKATYSWNEADLVGGGSLDAEVLVHHFVAGLSYTFGGSSPIP
ncbi:MAG: outer membrane protein [Propylenella sp.]